MRGVHSRNLSFANMPGLGGLGQPRQAVSRSWFTLRVEVVDMWKVYREMAVERNGAVFPDGAEVWRYARRDDALAAFRREVETLLGAGFHLSPEVVPQDMEGVVDYAGLEGDGLALVVLSREEEAG